VCGGSIRAMKAPCLATLCAALVLAGCATSRTITGPDGRPVHRISCDGSALSMDMCYEKAGDICGTAGYAVLNADGSATPMLYAGGGTLIAGAIVKRSLMVRCNGD
jgi:hypothetical protein